MAVRRTLDQGLIATSTAAAAFGVHEARYAIVPDAAATQGHGYLVFVPELLAFALALGLGLALRAAVTQGPRRQALRARPLLRWLLCSVALVATFCVQELLEGHRAAALMHDGGVVVLPLAAGFGLALSQLLRGGRRAIDAVARQLRHSASPPRVLPRPARGILLAAAARDARAPRAPVLARVGAGRAPPWPVSA